MLYRQNSEMASKTEEFMREFSRRSAHTIEVLDPDTREGDSLARVYDIVSYPAILVLTDDGQPLKSWEGDMLPLMDEVAAYTQ